MVAVRYPCAETIDRMAPLFAAMSKRKVSSMVEKETRSPAELFVLVCAILSVAFIASFSYFVADRSA